MVELDRNEKRNNHRETRRHYKLDTSREDSDCLEDLGLSVEDEVLVRRVLEVAKAVLTDKQLNAFRKVCIEGYTERDFAREAHISQPVVHNTLVSAKRTIKKSF